MAEKVLSQVQFEIEQIDQLFEYYSKHMNVAKPFWRILPFNVGNPDPLIANYCWFVQATYFKEKRLIEFYVRPDNELVLHEFMHHLTTEKLRILQKKMIQDLDDEQKRIMEAYIIELDPNRES